MDVGCIPTSECSRMEASSAGRRFLVGLALAAILLSNIALFAPVALYVGNKHEFSVGLTDLLAVYLLPVLIVAVICAGLGALLRTRLYRVYIVLIAALACLTWFQGNILLWDYGEFDGGAIPWGSTVWRGVIDSALWIAVLFTAVRFSDRLGKAFLSGAVITFLIQVSVQTIELARGNLAAPQIRQAAFDAGQKRAMFRFSRETNVLHIVMDGFQSDVFADIIKDPANSEIRDTLSGFTFFADNLGGYPYTQMTMPLLVSGQYYRNHKPIENFLQETMQGPTILNVAEQQGYEVDIASQVAIADTYARGENTNVYYVPAGEHLSTKDYALSDAIRLLDLALFRVAPHFVKAYIYQDEHWFLRRFASDETTVGLRYFSELEFMREVRDNLVVDRPNPTYKLFHLMLSHRPTVGNEQCEYDEVKRPGRLAVTLQARCGLLGVSGILERMKDLGIYDNTVVVLMADHGAWLNATGYDRSQSLTAAPTAVTAGLAVPTLAIKPRNATGLIRISAAPTSISDVPVTIAQLIGAQSQLQGSNVFELPEVGSRRRFFYDYAYGKNSKAPDFLHTLLEYEVVGSPFDSSAWRPVRRLRPGGITEAVPNVAE